MHFGDRIWLESKRSEKKVGLARKRNINLELTVTSSITTGKL